MNKLTTADENLIKDVLRICGRPQARELAKLRRSTVPEVQRLLDQLFKKLGNGRVSMVEEDGIAREVPHG